MGNVKIAKSKVPEGLVKKRARFAKQAAARNEAKAVAKKNNLLKRREFVAKARTYANAYAAEKKAALAQKKAAKAQGNFYVVRLNKASIQMLRIADPFIAWGSPSVETI